MTAPVGTVITDLPSVITQDSNGNPIQGVVVTFELSGGGVIIGAVATSNLAGIARLGGWVLGTTPRPYVVTATSGSLGSVSFRANAVVGPPSRMAKAAGDNQVAPFGQAVPVVLRVRVWDAYDNAISGVTVTFAVESGGGSLTGASTVTDSTGIAVLGSWTLGSSRDQRVYARSAGLPLQAFTATVLDPFLPCPRANRLSEDIPADSELTPTSCKDGTGRFFAHVPVELKEASAFLFTLASADFDTYLELWDESLTLVAINNNRGPATNSGIKALLQPGLYTLVATTHASEALGKYRTLYEKTTPSIVGCEEFFVTRGVSEYRESSNCPLSATEIVDRFRIYLKAGTTVAIAIEDYSYSAHPLTVNSAGGEVLAMGRFSKSYYVEEIEFTAPADGIYVITVTGGKNEKHQYELTVR